MADLEWYPQDWVDESVPPSKPRPEDFFFFDGENWNLGYGPDDKVGEDYRELLNRPVEIGAVISFMSCERLPDAEVVLKRSGDFDLIGGEIPHQHNVVMVDHDPDTIHDSLTELLAAIKRPEESFSVHGRIFPDGVNEIRVTLCFADWSDPVPVIFEVKDGKPVLTQVPEQKN